MKRLALPFTLLIFLSTNLFAQEISKFVAAINLALPSAEKVQLTIDQFRKDFPSFHYLRTLPRYNYFELEEMDYWIDKFDTATKDDLLSRYWLKIYKKGESILSLNLILTYEKKSFSSDQLIYYVQVLLKNMLQNFIKDKTSISTLQILKIVSSTFSE